MIKNFFGIKNNFNYKFKNGLLGKFQDFVDLMLKTFLKMLDSTLIKCQKREEM